MANNPRFTTLDLFSGIGGFALATEWANGKTLAFAEIADYPSRILAHHWPDIPNLKDVTQLCNDDSDTRNFITSFGIPNVITGGVPCQPTSHVGKKRGSCDSRWLWPDALRIVRNLQPRYVIFENPRALLTLENGNAFNNIIHHLANSGYDVQWDVISAAALGAGHRRERLWILATNPNSPRLERQSWNDQTHWPTQTRRHTTKENLYERTITCPLWYHQSGLQPVVNGLPARLARDQLTAIGNALVPQIAYLWLQSIANHLNP